MSSMRLSVTISLGGSCITRGSAGAKGTVASSYSDGKFRLNDEWRVVGSQDGSRQRSCARSAVVSLIELNMDGAGADPNGRRTRRDAMSSRTVMELRAALMDACTRL